MRARSLAGIFCLSLFMIAATAFAETDAEPGTGQDTAGFSYSIVPVHQFSSDMDNGGSFTLSSAQLRLGYFKPVARGTLLGASISYNHIDYSFSDPVAFGGQEPWGKVRSLDFGVPVLGRLNEKWSYMLAPSIGSYGEYGAGQSDSRTYGVVLAAGYSFAPQRKIGFGIGAFDRLGRSKLFPFVSINWRLSDQLRLSNPLRAGPTGAAGLELAYSMKNNWEAGIGFARRNFRFRLDDSGAAPNGIGEQMSRLVYVRLSKSLGMNSRLGLHLGSVRKSMLELRDSNEISLASTDNEAAPMLALSFESHF